MTFSVACLFGLVLLAQANLQVFHASDVRELGKKTKRLDQRRLEYAKRGGLFTVDGKPVAEDQDTYEFGLEFFRMKNGERRAQLPSSPGFFAALSEATDIPATDFEQLALAGVRRKVWNRVMTPEQTRRLQEVRIRWRADGVSLQRSGRRVYPLGFASAGLVGRMRGPTNKEVESRGDAPDKYALVPSGGLELSLNEKLVGVHGVTVGLVDGKGDFLPQRISDETRGKVDGQNAILSIHSELQTVAADAVRKAVEENRADQGVAIVLDPKSGDVLAMANWPTFDPNASQDLTIGGRRATDFNPAYMAAFEPGSTFKILTLAEAMDLGVVGPNDAFYCRGEMPINAHRTVHCAAHNGSRAHGQLDPEKAIAVSCNVTAAQWALRVGSERMTAFLDKLHLLDKPGLSLAGERTGLFDRNAYDKRHQTAVLGFGQAVNVTPLRLATAFAMLGNDGVAMKPRIVRQIGGRKLESEPIGQIVRPETAHTLLRYMESVIDSDRGTGKTLRIPGFRLGGKTGTAQKIQKGGMKGYVSNFVGFVPAENPKAVVLVMIDNPTAGKYYGGSVAGPVFVDIAKAAIRVLGVSPEAAPTRVGPATHAAAKEAPLRVQVETRVAP
ncbi:MAG: penicillin-binding protein 2 [Fimbriimonadaceae bacterium]|nr:penicillin-binding protein 2 [Fimbriimonadaceae bacterium]